MGCDIHMYVEVLHEEGGRAGGGWVMAMAEEATYHHRNGLTFAVLSGLDAEELGVTPIAPARGLPDDVSVEVQRRCDGWKGDGHTHSWLTLAEVRAFPWPANVPRHFPDWAASTLEKVGANRTTLSLWPPEEIRLVFWFDN